MAESPCLYRSLRTWATWELYIDSFSEFMGDKTKERFRGAARRASIVGLGLAAFSKKVGADESIGEGTEGKGGSVVITAKVPMLGPPSAAPPSDSHSDAALPMGTQGRESPLDLDATERFCGDAADRVRTRPKPRCCIGSWGWRGAVRVSVFVPRQQAACRSQLTRLPCA